MAWKNYGEAIEMVERRFQLLPHIFRWRGRLYRVSAVERYWTVPKPEWRRRVVGHYFRVQCAEGTFEVYQDVRANTWHLRRVSWAPARTATARTVAAAWR
jgi:hypothetical protein